MGPRAAVVVEDVVTEELLLEDRPLEVEVDVKLVVSPSGLTDALLDDVVRGSVLLLVKLVEKVLGVALEVIEVLPLMEPLPTLLELEDVVVLPSMGPTPLLLELEEAVEEVDADETLEVVEPPTGPRLPLDDADVLDGFTDVDPVLLLKLLLVESEVIVDDEEGEVVAPVGPPPPLAVDVDVVVNKEVLEGSFGPVGYP